jgi:hypothetical protein
MEPEDVAGDLGQNSDTFFVVINEVLTNYNQIKQTVRKRKERQQVVDSKVSQLDEGHRKNNILISVLVALGGLVVSVLATGPNVRGRGRWILKVIKFVARLPSEGK